MHIRKTTVESFKIISNERYLSSNTNSNINGIENNVYKIKTHILLIFKLHVYKSRERGTLELSRLINEIKKVKLKKIQPKIM